MEPKHFSHHHPLILHHVLPTSQYHCSGCKSPASGNVYVCYYQCRFYLHEQCYHAPRSLKHPSHPLHPLTIVPSPTHPSASFLCDSCNLAGDGISYTCSACDVDLHLHCALMPYNPNTFPSPSPVLSQNFNTPQVYPPPLSNPPPQNATIPNHIQNHTQSQSTIPNYIQQNHSQSQSTIPNHTQNHPQSQSTIPNQTKNHPQSQSTIPNHTQNQPQSQSTAITNPQNKPPLGYSQQNQPPLGYPQQNPPPQSSTPATEPPPSPQHTLAPANTIKHFSHPHVLKQMEFDGGSETPKICSACEVKIPGSGYCCTEPYCTFSLDKGCFDSPREVRHRSHPGHPLTLLTAPPYSGGSFTCDACRTEGKAYTYTCRACSYDLHIDCIRWPETLTRPDHEHPLTLYYGGAAFRCGACGEAAGEKGWAYYCRKCDFGVHVGWCVNSEIKPESGGGGGATSSSSSVEEEMMRFQMQKMNLDFQLQMAKQQAQMIASIGNSVNGLV